MAASNKTAAPAAPKPPRKPRTARVLTAVEQSLLSDSNEQLNKARAVAKEAKSLAKVIGCIGKLSDWGISKVLDAVDARQKALHPAPVPAAE
jgi:hypothetical protein